MGTGQNKWAIIKEGGRTSRVRNARMGERSMVPPIGGMMPRKRFRYGSVMDPSGPMIWAGGLGNHVNTRRAMIAVL